MFSFSITVPYNGRNLYGLISLVHQHPAQSQSSRPALFLLHSLTNGPEQKDRIERDTSLSQGTVHI
jgi:hypothetical protein